jgi:iron complex outermembrane receptor protein
MPEIRRQSDIITNNQGTLIMESTASIRQKANLLSFKRNTLCAAVSAALLSYTGANLAVAQETPGIEEVVVTGSFIRRSEGFTGASSITQFDAADLAEQGTLNLGEVVQNLSFVAGAASAITNTIQGTSSRNTFVDLRGLGASSTLTLLDGKRLVEQNVNALIPTIAIQRVDIVTDGAAALYGSEAVAGVVNFIPYKSYDGFKVDQYTERDSRGDYEEHHTQMMWGGEVGEVDVVLAGQFRKNNRLRYTDRPKLAQAGLVMSSNSPGNYFVPERDADGQITGDLLQRPDPNCTPAAERQSYRPGVINNPTGILDESGVCWKDFGDHWSYREPTQTNQFYANATWDASDDLTLSFQGFSTRLRQISHGSSSNPGNSRLHELPAIRGELPGNPFRAVAADGRELFAQPLRDEQGNVVTNAVGRAMPMRDADGNVVLAQNQFASLDADPMGGVPLYEDVMPRTLRPINKTHTQSDGHNPTLDNQSHSTDRIHRWTLEADFRVPYLDDWRGTAAYTQNQRDFVFHANQNFDITAMIQGLNCDVINDLDACYNPFFVMDQATNNTVHVMNAVHGRSRKRVEQQLDTFDFILTGDVPAVELPSGPIGAAVGYQYRQDSFRNTPSAAEFAGVTWIGTADREFQNSGTRHVNSYFLELAVPVLSNLELEMAVRHEDFSTGQQSTDPKFGITYSATDWLTLRATHGSAFIAPSIGQLLNPVSCGDQSVTDRFGPQSAFTTACGGGNPTLQNESSKSMQFGADVVFGNFDMSVTWNNTDFSNRIININAQAKMNADFANFRRLTGFTGTGELGDQPTEQQLRDWVANPASDKDIIRSPNDIYTVLQVNNVSTTNAQRVDVTAYDIAANYNFYAGDIGDFRLGLQATYVDEFLYQQTPDSPIRDGAGGYNSGTSAAPSLPRWKGNLTAGWTRGSHSVTTITRYVHSMGPYDGPQFPFMDGFANTNRPPNLTEVRAWTQMDASYTYRGLNAFNGELSLTVGARNVFDRDPQKSPEFAGVLGALQNPLGRMLYGRVVFDF